MIELSGQRAEIFEQSAADATTKLTKASQRALGLTMGAQKIKTKAADAPHVGPDEWLKAAPRTEGSWWPEWTTWLAARSGEPCEPPPMGAGPADGRSLPDAPGDYVR